MSYKEQHNNTNYQSCYWGHTFGRTILYIIRNTIPCENGQRAPTGKPVGKNRKTGEEGKEI